MRKLRNPKATKSAKKTPDESHCRHHGNVDKNEQKRCVRRATNLLHSLTGETFDSRYDELTELTGQLAADLRISKSLQFRRRKARCTVTGKTDEQAASSLSQDVQDKLANIPQESQVVSEALEEENTKNAVPQRCKNSAREKGKGDTTMVSASDKEECRAKYFVTNQANTQPDNKKRHSKLTRKNKSKAEGENKSSTGNVFKENVPDKIEEQAASSLMDVQDGTTQLANTSQESQVVSRSKALEEENARNATPQKCKNSLREKGDTRMVSAGGKEECKTKNFVTNQADAQRDNKERHSKLTKKNSNRGEAETKSSTGNVLKENCSQEIIRNDARKKNTDKAGKKTFTRFFENHIPVPKMMNILKRPNGVQYVKGNLRINPFAQKYAYLRLNNEERDLLIIGSQSRNRAFEGDLVVACVNPEHLWRNCTDGELQKTGHVVCILEKVHSRKAVGYLKRQESRLLFYPKDQRIPLVEILLESVPALYFEQPELCKNTMFFVNIDLWERPYAFGRIISVVGKCGEIDTELNAIILENNLDVSPYQESLLEGLPDSDYILTDADIEGREEWRHECIFTIDPVTAVDIDDALSCKVLGNGNYEIGVHISDVTHYLEFFSPLDMEVLKRATTVYLPHMTSHMLPEKLCKVCSLLPGKDKLAFSVIWEITPDAEIVKHRFARTVVRSCCQMSYDSAQAMIDDPNKSWPEDFLDIKGDYTASLLSDKVNKLFKLSTQLRDKRFVNGALRLDKPKLQIHIDPKLSRECGIPIPVNYCVYERIDSNSLIEEFMLLANITVAAQLHSAFPKTALLRIHKDPSKKCLDTVQNTLQNYGIHLNVETAGALQASISRYENNSATINSMKHIMMVIVNLCSKTMIRAEYICASTTSRYNLKHYALNVPLYTHFTSPIRRYSDCIVHRLLGATLENKPLPEKWTVKLCSKIAANCNTKKYSAKLAQEQSTEVFFAYMVGLAGGFEAVATVVYVKGDCIDAILCDIGIRIKVNFKDIENIATSKFSEDHVPTLTINWVKPPIVQVINLFSLVNVHVMKISEELRLKATLIPPPQQSTEI
ncbi:PREDICTED: DIS3-like exonuclease 2 [Wasmannia auropunctata]|uniref:DIS3-like exonuclease 2 n=1 Tax=Wasmannia auropunctata TaxID=64793 RepID=UPI0005F05DC9|nr:PREDICTED: DIS3-like exonuclease 2 [Wasmannia auropunctata]XP_011696305.1 PREDICTED: DIS3-like exonuclease 2 [Wasmannia auropunctata]XP_011696306.1 PREDICTED: DIS3-like exonuclease 2 [Wasmannia auropunctata]